MVEFALYQPDIPQNLGAMLRLSACLGIGLHIIEPCGFPLDDKRMRRAGMDYIDHAHYRRHQRWDAFHAMLQERGGRLVLMTTKASVSYFEHSFGQDDVILFGRESAGVPESVHAAADYRLIVPMKPGARSLNLAMSAAMVAGEAMRQLGLSS